MSIQAVFFDMGGTIETFDYTHELRLNATSDIQQKLLSAGIDLRLGNEQLLNVITSGLGRYHRWRMQSLVELPPQRVWREYILVDYPVDGNALDSIAEGLLMYYETHFYCREMRPEMPAVLDEIQKMGLKIGLISNVSSRGQVPFNLKAYGIWHYFNPIVLSSEYGRRKPDPAIFHHAARLADVPTSQCLYIGDRISRDIVGARKAGFRMAIQIRHDFDHGEEDVGATPDAVVDNMMELLDILRIELNRSSGDTLVNHKDPQQISALFFDAGDILYYRPNRHRRLNAFLNELGLNAKKDHLGNNDKLAQRAYEGKITQDQYREAILRLYGVTQPDHIQRGKQILEEEHNDISFFEGVPETLKALKDEGYLLGIITDTSSPLHTKLEWFERGGFGEVWDSIISSKELGVRKPNPKIYHAALRQLGLSAKQAVFIGHNPSELDGARAIGMKTVAFNYAKEAKADFYIQRFSDLLDVPIINRLSHISSR